MNDLISREAAIDLLKQMRKDGDMIPWEGKDVFARIRKLPSAEPERKKGKWVGEERQRLIDETDDGCVYMTDTWWYCSECGNPKGYVGHKPEDKYCNECGADMRGEQE